MGKILVFVALTVTFVTPNEPQQQARLHAAPSPEMERLARAFDGKWSTHEVFAHNKFYPNGAERTGVAEFHLVTAGTALIENVSSDGSAGKLQFMVVLWWDGNARTYKMFTCGNTGAEPCHIRGTLHWEGDKLVNNYDLNIRGVSHKAIDVFDQISGRSFRLVFSADLFHQGMEPLITTTYVRQ